MEEYRENGVRPGWQLNRQAHQVFLYRPDQPVDVFDNLESISGDPELPGILLDLRPIREPGFRGALSSFDRHRSRYPLGRGGNADAFQSVNDH